MGSIVQGWINPWAKGAAALGPQFYRAPTFDFGYFFQPIPYYREIYILQGKIKIIHISLFI